MQYTISFFSYNISVSQFQKHPDCHEVKKDADILAENVGTYVGVSN